MNRCLTVLFIVVFLSGCKSKSDEKIESGLKMKVGFSQNLIFKSDIDAGEMGVMHDVSEVRFRLDSITQEGLYYFNCKILLMTFFTNLFGESESFDSENPKSFSHMNEAEQETFKELNPLLTKPFFLVTDEFGNVLEGPIMDGEITTSDILTNMTPVPIILPEGEIFVGKKWSFTSINAVMASMEISNEAEVAEITSDKIFINVTKTTKELSGAQSVLGVYELDKKTRRILKGENEIKAQGLKNSKGVIFESKVKL